MNGFELQILVFLLWGSLHFFLSILHPVSQEVQVPLRPSLVSLSATCAPHTTLRTYKPLARDGWGQTSAARLLHTPISACPLSLGNRQGTGCIIVSAPCG